MKSTIQDLTHEEKLKVWFDYRITQNALKLFPPILKLNKNFEPSKGSTIYPAWGVYVMPIEQNKKPLSFDDFCKVTDSRISECLTSWFWKFKERIFN